MSSFELEREETKGVIFKFGIIGDTQYVDAENFKPTYGTCVRRYRQSLEVFRKCNEYLNQESVSCSILVGDIIDGKSKVMGIQEECIAAMLSAATIANSWHYCIGNHDVDALTRDRLYDLLVPDTLKAVCTPTTMYYHFAPHPGYRFIILDSFDISTLCASSPEMKEEADKLLAAKNPNIAAGGDWYEGLAPEDFKYNPANGGMGEAQVNWLRQVLDDARDSHEICFVFSHLPIHPQACENSCLLWNNEVILDVLQQSGCVAAYICGHNHAGGYSNEGGIHHFTLPAPLECPQDDVNFGYIAVHDSYMDVNWCGPPWRGGQPYWETNEWPTRMEIQTSFQKKSENS